MVEIWAWGFCSRGDFAKSGLRKNQLNMCGAMG